MVETYQVGCQFHLILGCLSNFVSKFNIQKDRKCFQLAIQCYVIMMNITRLNTQSNDAWNSREPYAMQKNPKEPLKITRNPKEP